MEKKKIEFKMNINETMKNKLKEILKMKEAGDYQAAFEEIKKLEKEKIANPKVLLWKAILAQLIDVNGITLEEIESTLEECLKIDEDYIPALLELGWFNYAVMDNLPKADSYFNQSIISSIENLHQSILGKLKCMIETQSKEEAEKFLNQISSQILNFDKLKEELNIE